MKILKEIFKPTKFKLLFFIYIILLIFIGFIFGDAFSRDPLHESGPSLGPLFYMMGFLIDPFQLWKNTTLMLTVDFVFYYVMAGIIESNYLYIKQRKMPK